MTDKPKDLAVDADDVQDEETDLMFAYTNRDDDSEKPIDLISDYLPQEDDWSAKTRLDEDHPEMMTGVEMLPRLFPEIEEKESLLEEWIYKYEKRLTSVGGLSREEYVTILEAMSGGGTGGVDDRASILEQVMSTPDDD